MLPDCLLWSHERGGTCPASPILGLPLRLGGRRRDGVLRRCARQHRVRGVLMPALSPRRGQRLPVRTRPGKRAGPQSGFVAEPQRTGDDIRGTTMCPNGMARRRVLSIVSLGYPRKPFVARSGTRSLPEVGF